MSCDVSDVAVHSDFQTYFKLSSRGSSTYYNMLGNFGNPGKDTIMEHRPRGNKTFFMLNSAEHETFSANTFKMSTIVGSFIFISRELFMLSYG